jgi:hypothetical protein
MMGPSSVSPTARNAPLMGVLARGQLGGAFSLVLLCVMFSVGSSWLKESKMSLNSS